jgi:hypothetical protein
MKRNIKTYSDFINEARSKKWLDDVVDDDGNSNNIRLDDTIRIRALEYIYESGTDGRRYTDIIKFIIEDIKGDSYNYKTHRGHYSQLMTGIPGSHWGRGGRVVGILYKYCTRNENNRWVLTNDQLIEHFMKDDFKGILDDNARAALAELLR